MDNAIRSPTLVTPANLDATITKMAGDLKQASAVAFDLEYSGLRCSAESKPTLFDDAARRYQRMRRTVDTFEPLQVGIALMFESESEKQCQVLVYTFFLKPGAYKSFTAEPYQVCKSEMSALRFLSRSGFSFDQAVAHGVNFSNDAEEATIRRALVDKRALDERIRKTGALHAQRFDDAQREMRRCVDEVEERFKSKQCREFELRHGFENVPGCLMLHRHLRMSNKYASTRPASNRSISTIRVRRLATARRHPESLAALDQWAIDHCLGFTRAFRLLRAETQRRQLPVVGHNCFLDLMWMYDRFFRPLPDSYDEYKRSLHDDLFPLVFDTKLLYRAALEWRQSCTYYRQERDADFGADLHTAFKEVVKEGCFAYPYLQSVGNQFFTSIHDLEKVDFSGESAHDAGFDAFQTSAVFLRLARRLWANSQISDYSSHRTMHDAVAPMGEYCAALQHLSNRVPVARSLTKTMTLGGADVVSPMAQLAMRVTVSDEGLLSREERIALGNGRFLVVFGSENGYVKFRTRMRKWQLKQADLQVRLESCDAAQLISFLDLHYENQ